MSLRLARRTLHIERVAGEGSAETVVEGTVRLPDRYPPIGRALQLTAHPVVSHVEPTDDRVLVEGVVRLGLLYAAHEQPPSDAEGKGAPAERPQRAEWEDGLPFACLLTVNGATEESDVDVEARVASVAYEVRGDDESVDVDVVLKVHARLVGTDLVELTVAAAGPGVACETEEVRVRSKLAEIETTGRAGGSLSFAGRSLPEQILDVRVVPALTEVTHEEGRAVIRGFLDCDCLYLAGDGAGAQYVEWPKGLLFELSVPCAAIPGYAVWEPNVTVAQADYYVEHGAEGGALRLDLQIKASAAAYRGEIVSCVRNITSDQGDVACRVEELQVYEAVGEGTSRTELQGVLELPEGLPPIERVLRGDAHLVVEEVHVLGDKVAIEGRINVELLYVGRTEGGGELQAARWPYAVTFDVEVPVPGAEPGLDRSVHAAVRRLEFDLINRETVEVRMQAVAEARVGRMRTLDVVAEAVEVPPAEADPPTFRFVVTTEDDTLWKLAQLYRTTPEAILAHNDWIDPAAPLGKGRKVCIVHGRQAAS